MAKKHVETYSSSDAAAQNPEERGEIIKTAHNKKANRQGKWLTYKLEWPKSPAKTVKYP